MDGHMIATNRKIAMREKPHSPGARGDAPLTAFLESGISYDFYPFAFNIDSWLHTLLPLLISMTGPHPMIRRRKPDSVSSQGVSDKGTNNGIHYCGDLLFVRFVHRAPFATRRAVSFAVPPV